jgi:hypothetical protein
MKKIILVLTSIITISLFSLKSFSQGQYFQGTIEYSLEYKTDNPNIQESNLKQYFGSKVITKFREGNFISEYYNEDNVLVKTSTLNLNKKKYYYELTLIDTLYFSNIDRTLYNTQIEQLADSTVFNNECWTIKSIATNQENFNDNVTSHYYLSKKLKVNPNWYQDYIDGAYNKIFRMAPGVFIKSVIKGKYFTEIRSMVSMKKEKINLSEFEVKSKKIKKKMN